MHTQYTDDHTSGFAYTDIETTVLVTILAVLFATGIAIF